jgi:hypothetical protein
VTVAQSARWVMDTSTFSHFCRAGHADLLRLLAPEGLILKGDSPRKNLGECAVLSCAIHRGMVAVIDDGDARIQAKAVGCGS